MEDVLFILIIYQTTIEDSKACDCLKNLLGKDWRTYVYLHDNTENNIFLAEAYNQGVKHALALQKDWVVLLDADTEITQDYLNALNNIVSHRQTGVWVPDLLNADAHLLSPFRHNGVDTAFNSGMLLPVKDIQAIGGFNLQYPLDYLDYWVCWQLSQRRIPLHRMNVKLRHNLSVLDYKQVSRERYLSLLEAEHRFAAETGHLLKYKIVLMGRAIKWALLQHRYFKETAKALWR